MLPYLSPIRPRAEAQPATVKRFKKSSTTYTPKINHGHLNAKKRRERPRRQRTNHPIEKVYPKSVP